MDEQGKSLRERVVQSIRSRMVSGVLVLIPLGFTFLVLRFLFQTTAGLLTPITESLFGPMPEVLQAVLSIAVLLVLVYGVGVVTAHVVGRRLLWLGGVVLRHIPIVRPIYSAARQVIDAFGAGERKSFRRVVFVEFPRPGVKALGFVTGTVVGPDGRQLQRVFLPAALMPTAGLLLLVPSEEVEETDLTVDEAMKMLISGGILTPGRFEGGGAPPPREAIPGIV